MSQNYIGALRCNPLQVHLLPANPPPSLLITCPNAIPPTILAILTPFPTLSIPSATTPQPPAPRPFVLAPAPPINNALTESSSLMISRPVERAQTMGESWEP
ncbi:BZ3500_MvSof-1268-A1-R1_Chr2-2g05029 [Microbotryum saponariae]|uniref:BZ3500_MvSof-1268-A1-R1_Chr2-2g05029 protein n=1 Tax=Microbotryum saponariae TaxID=289078 RepID=A0A2X0KWY3_9BASI|nr:BZ3500_MvSof-1268-A1-R1_Chr2-2g05029 [Microbotryum saponariae]SDA00739.1 BZ3501_MvSof-1269-A2-R1_Chr2-2g04703 [Microbotryum saponariae]